MVFLCGAASAFGPPGTPVCESDGKGNGTVRGVITAEAVLGIEAQNFSGGGLKELRKVIRSGSAYINLHTDRFQSG